MSDQMNNSAAGYLALPPGGSGPGIVVLHAWWGLNDFFRTLCDRLAESGYVAYAPDLYDGKVVDTPAEAETLMEQSDERAMRAAALGALELMREHPAVAQAPLKLIGFSMGAAWAALLSALRPDEVDAAVFFYGAVVTDFEAARATYLAHMAEDDPWEPEENVQAMESAIRAAGRAITIYRYPGAGHWFMESNRPDDYNAEAAELAWQRTLRFLAER